MDSTREEKENQDENNRQDQIEMEDIQVSSSSFGGENCGEEPSELATEVKEERGQMRDGGETQGSSLKRSSCQAVLIGISIGLLCGVIGVLFLQIESLIQMQTENNPLKKLLNSTHQTITLLSAENTQLKVLLKNTMQEKTQLQVENDELNKFLNSTLENRDLVVEENRQLKVVLNQSLHIIALAAAESKQWRLLLNNEQRAFRKLEAENQLQRSILFSNKLSFLWRFCSTDTLHCSRCIPGWIEHASRCFFLPQDTKKWEDARRECLDLGGDLAVVLNADDQAFLTNMTFQFRQQHPQEHLLSAWVGLQDMVTEGVYIWVNGNSVHRNVTYWRHQEANNTMASRDKDGTGQDCVAIVPPSHVGHKGWLKSWDDAVCSDKRHYLCETTALTLS